MATDQAVKPAPQPPPDPGPSVVLETFYGGRRISVVISYSVIADLRASFQSTGEVASGPLSGSLAEDHILVEHCGPAANAPVGVYRTQPAGWPAVTAPDCKRLAAAMPKANAALLLVVRTLARRPWSAALFLVNPSHPSPDDPPLVEFPFDEYLLRNGWLTDLAPPPPPLTAIPRPRRRGLWIASFLAVLLLAVGAAAWRLEWLPVGHPAAAAEVPAPAPAIAPPIGLRAVPALDDFEVSWNRSSELVRSATGATLTIRNGPVDRTVPVSRDQLREGRIMYHPISGVDVSFRLELTMPDGRSEADSIQVLGFDTAPSLMLPIPAPRNPTPTPTPAPAPAVRPIPSDSAPMPLHRAKPVLSPEVMNDLRRAAGPISVSVLIDIDAAGRVTTARIASTTGEPSPSALHVRTAALAAAHQWSFRPATAHGRPVASNLTLAFNF